MKSVGSCQLNYASASAASASSHLKALARDFRDFISHSPLRSMKKVKCEKAKSDKSSCKKCQKKIGFNEMRAGVDCWMGGQTVTAWLHMKCMSECFKFDRCKAKGKCKLSGETMEKGEARLELAKEYTGIFFRLKHSAAALSDFLKERAMDPKLIKGYGILSADEKKHLWKSKKFSVSLKRPASAMSLWGARIGRRSEERAAWERDDDSWLSEIAWLADIDTEW